MATTSQNLQNLQNDLTLGNTGELLARLQRLPLDERDALHKELCRYFKADKMQTTQAAEASLVLLLLLLRGLILPPADAPPG